MLTPNVTSIQSDPFIQGENGRLQGMLVAFLAVFIIIVSKIRSRFKISKGIASAGKDPFKYAHNLFRIRIPILDGLYNILLFRKDGVHALDKMTEQFGYQYQVDLGTTRTYVVGDPNMAQKLLSSSEPGHLIKAGAFYDWIFTEFFKDGLVNSKYETWFPHRKMLSRCFTYKSLQHYVKIMDKHGKGLVNFLKAETQNVNQDYSPESETIHDALYFHAMKIIHEILMGTDRFSDEILAEFTRIFNSHKHDVLDRLMNPFLQFPPYWYFHSMKKRYDYESNYLTSFVMKVTKEYRKERDEMIANGEYEKYFQVDEDADVGVKPFRCVIEEMLYCEASDKEVYDEIGTLIGAGHETTVIATEMFLMHLALNQDCQKLCREEVDNLIKGKLDDELTTDDLSSLKYLERCIMESGRLTSTVPVFIRTLESPLRVSDDFEFPAGSTVSFLTWVMHKNPEYFPDPLKFDPDRFLPENIKCRHPYSYLPFSSGPRNCIGWKVGIMEMKVLMARILQNFEVFSNDKFEDVKLKFEVTLHPERNYNLIFKSRFID